MSKLALTTVVLYNIASKNASIKVKKCKNIFYGV